MLASLALGTLKRTTPIFSIIQNQVHCVITICLTDKSIKSSRRYIYPRLYINSFQQIVNRKKMWFYTVQAKMSVMFFLCHSSFLYQAPRTEIPPYHWHSMWKPEPQDHCGLQCFLYQMRAKKGKFSLECVTYLKPALLEKVAFELCGKYIMVNNLLKHTPLKEAT